MKLKTGFFAYKCPGGRAKPDIVDFNSDGRKDILIGTEKGKIVVLLNSGTATEPRFKKETHISIGSVGPRISPTVVDFNNDGRKDLLVVNEFSTLYYLENQGSDSHPQFKPPVILKAGGQEIKNFFLGGTGYRARIDVADYNNDGKQDIIYAATSKQTSRAQIVVFPAE